MSEEALARQIETLPEPYVSLIQQLVDALGKSDKSVYLAPSAFILH